MPEDERSPAAGYLSVLRQGEVEVEGRLPWSSNRTFLVTCAAPGCSLPAVYKPHRGERPLWDFPDGLYRREAAAYELSRALGWGLVPETVVRDDAPMGVGSLQRFVPADFEQHYFSLLEEPTHHQALRAIAAFDLVANNADRKSGHCLLGEDGRIWAIDNGLCFHPEPKLRTVIWDFGGEPIGEELLADLDRLSRSLPAALASLLSPEEHAALARRLAAVVEVRRYPDPNPDYRSYPWPLV
jgi:uncharacterized repeat protein (TIGR03843 family)